METDEKFEEERSLMNQLLVTNTRKTGRWSIDEHESKGSEDESRLLIRNLQKRKRILASMKRRMK